MKNALIIITLSLHFFLGLAIADHYDSLRVQREFSIIFEDYAELSTPIKCGTPIILDIMRNKKYLTAEQRELFDSRLDDRPRRDSYYYTPEGHFKIHYNSTDVDTNYVRRCGEFFERSWSVEIDSLGFLEPVPDDTLGGDSRFDVYITDFYWAIYGWTVPDDMEGPAPWHDVSAYIEVNSSYEGFPENDDPEGSDWGAFKVTCAHEFFHAIQMAYDPDEQVWLLEIASVWMEDIVFDYVNDYYNYMEDFFDQPWISIMQNDGSHEYGSAHWFHYLEQNYSAGIINGILDQIIYSDGMNAISLALDSAGLSIYDEFSQFVGWNYLTGSRADSFHYTEAHRYPEIHIETTVSGLPFTFAPDYAHTPRSFGSNYIEMDSGLAENIRVSITGDAPLWKIAVIFPQDSSYVSFPDSDGIVSIGNSVCAIAILPMGTYSSSTRYSYNIYIEDIILELSADAGEDRYLCYGEEIEIGGSPSAIGGTSPFTYSWTPSYGLDDSTSANPTVSPETTTNYTLTIIDAVGDTAIDSITVFVDAPFSVDFMADTVFYLVEDTVDVYVDITSTGTPPYTYQWSPEELFDEPTDSVQTFLLDSTVTVMVEVTDSFGCVARDTMTIVLWNKISEMGIPKDMILRAYPNPFNSAIYIETRNGGMLTICDIGGNIIHSQSVESGIFKWTPHNIPAGIYIVDLSSNSVKILYLP